MKLESPFYRLLRYAFIVAVFSFSTQLAPASQSILFEKHRVNEKQIIGQWRGRDHVRVFYGDGSFFINPEPEGRPLGKWRIQGDLLTIRLPGTRTEKIERIIKLTPTELVVTVAGKKYSYKRIEHY